MAFTHHDGRETRTRRTFLPPCGRGRQRVSVAVAGWGASAKRSKKRLQHAVRVGEHVIVPEADQTITSRLDPAGSRVAFIGKLSACGSDDFRDREPDSDGWRQSLEAQAIANIVLPQQLRTAKRRRSLVDKIRQKDPCWMSVVGGNLPFIRLPYKRHWLDHSTICHRDARDEHTPRNASDTLLIHCALTAVTYQTLGWRGCHSVSRLMN